MPKLKFTSEEIYDIFHSALCNGLSYIHGYELYLEYDDEEYNKAKVKLDNPTYEDVLIQILKDNGTLIIEDSEEIHKITKTELFNRIKDVDFDVISNFINQEDDAVDADIVIQTIAFGEVIYG